MWEIIAKLIPPPLLLGLLLYALICFLWLQPLNEERMAVAFIKQCEAGDLPAIARSKPAPEKAAGDSLSSPAMEIPLSLQIIAELKSIVRDETAAVALPYEASGSACSCAVSRAFDRVFWPSLAHTMSVRTYTPRPIRYFDQYVAREMASGLCAAGR